MTDSVDRPSSPPMPEELKNKLRTVKRTDVERFEELPTYVRTACAMHELMGMTWEEVGDRLGKKPATVSKYTKYTAYKNWREELQEASRDPKLMAEVALRSSAFGVTMEYLAAFDKAVAAGSYDVVGKMAKDLLDRAGVVAKKQDTGAITVKIQLGAGGAIEVPAIEAEWEPVETERDD